MISLICSWWFPCPELFRTSLQGHLQPMVPSIFAAGPRRSRGSADSPDRLNGSCRCWCGQWSRLGWLAGTPGCPHTWARTMTNGAEAREKSSPRPFGSSNTLSTNEYTGKIHYKWPFSIAMLVHQRVYIYIYNICIYDNMIIYIYTQGETPWVISWFMNPSTMVTSPINPR